MARRAQNRRPRLIGYFERAAIDPFEEVGSVKLCKRDICKVNRATIRIAADDPPIVADRNLLQLAGRKAILLQQVHFCGAIWIGKLRYAAGTMYQLHVPD